MRSLDGPRAVPAMAGWSAPRKRRRMCGAARVACLLGCCALAACAGRGPRGVEPTAEKKDAAADVAGVQPEAFEPDPLLDPISSDPLAPRVEPPDRSTRNEREDPPDPPRGETTREASFTAPPVVPVVTPVVATTPTVAPDPTLADLIAATERDLAAHPADQGLRKRVAELYVMSGRYPEAARAFEEVDFSGDEFARLTYAGLMNRLGEDRKAAEALDAVRRGWRRSHEMRIPVASFAQGAIRGPGLYTPVEQPTFVRGQKTWVYLEVENFTSRQSAGGKYQVGLRVDFAILDSTKKPVPWPDLARYNKDLRRDQTDDFGDLCLPLVVILPKDLAPGAYTLSIKVRDLQGDKTTEASLPFSIQ